MTVSQIGPLTAALKDRLLNALASQGIGEDGEDQPDIPVFTDVTDERHQIYARIDMGAMLQGNSNFGHADRHAFQVRVVHEQMGLEISDPDAELSRVSGLIADALKKWAPLEGANEIKFVSSFEAEEPDPAVRSRVCRFTVTIFGE